MAVKKEDVLAYLEKANMMEVSELISDIEEKFGVSAAAPVAVAAAPAAGGGEGSEAKSEFDVVLTAAGQQKINVIKDARGKNKMGFITHNISFKRNSINGFLSWPSSNEDFNNDPRDHKVLNENITSSNFAPIDSFFEIAPIDYEIDNSSRKELSSVPLSEVDFPRIVYMVVDKKIELEIKLLKDFPEWQFLPQEDLNRKTIEIFFDLNIAKRSCNKEQKVLKVTNTDVFRIASPVLIAKGISRIVCAENLIAL